ncbi:hypothetical protein HH303_04405 [Rhodospirillaceae bacterium KN72]|uniref:TIM-barrel domain-containing protein n=1 Tax=Pacificispira spongiicola TaxID=2729598 RepID=A0A7Y0DY15_9PROT|nr:hypothetical protein [Pacificispira spongiicola]NMM43707.1 hypothetical protein [Pacificispira spongiicola]
MPVLTWEIAARAPSESLPSRIVTERPPLPPDRFPPEIGLLLPAAREGNGIQSFMTDMPDPGGTAVGMFLANPFLNVSRTARHLIDSGIQWISNFPSIDQQDIDFGQQLDDVGLDRTFEFRTLKTFADTGLKSLAVLCDPAGVPGALASRPAAVLTVPRVADFAAGLPSMRYRGTLADTIMAALREAGWNGPVLAIGTRIEATSPTLWPDMIDGLLLRPAP